MSKKLFPVNQVHHTSGMGHCMVYDYKTFVQDIQQLAAQLMHGCNWTDENAAIVYMPRGGAPIACYLAHRMGLKNIYSLEEAMFHLPAQAQNFTVFLVDDIYDTGNTMEQSLGRLAALAQGFNIVTATLWIRDIGLTPGSPDFTIRLVIGDAWIIFPWEDPSASVNNRLTIV